MSKRRRRGRQGLQAIVLLVCVSTPPSAVLCSGTEARADGETRSDQHSPHTQPALLTGRRLPQAARSGRSASLSARVAVVHRSSSFVAARARAHARDAVRRCLRSILLSPHTSRRRPTSRASPPRVAGTTETTAASAASVTPTETDRDDDKRRGCCRSARSSWAAECQRTSLHCQQTSGGV